MNFHARLLKLGLDADPVAAARLIKAYASLRHPSSLTYARRVFDRVPPLSRDAVLCAAVVSAYARAHLSSPAIKFFTHLLASSSASASNPFLLSSLARAVGSTSDPALPGSVHCHVTKLGLDPNVVVATSILDAYSKCGDLASACRLFDEMPQRNRITWNAMISAYATAGMGPDALNLFYRLKCIEFELGVDEFTVSSVLTAAAGIGDSRLGEQIHGYMIVSGFGSDSAVASAIANMYFRCGEVESAETVMEGREVSTMERLMMINGYVFNERYMEALGKIRCGSDLLRVLMVDGSVVVSIVTACANLGLLHIGRKVHGIVVILGICENMALGSALIDMYCKCLHIGDAHNVLFSFEERQVSHWNSMIAGCMHCSLLEEARGYFDKMPIKNVISWTAMISGYVQCGYPEEALQLLTKLYSEEELIRGNCYTFVSALDACSSLAGLDAGKQVHGQALKMLANDHGNNHLVLSTALVDMYSKSGNLAYARRVFDRMYKKNVVSWTSMIAGYASHGNGLEAVGALEQMMATGIKPNEVTFVSILNACSHSGLIKQGMHYFNVMRERYNISPRGDHYACLIDMLARSGHLEEAWKTVEEIKGKILDGVDGPAIMGALLAGCQMHGNVEIGSKVAEEMSKRRNQTSETCIALSNVYASAKMWDKVQKIREESKKQGVVRKPGVSLILAGANG